jgi:hypothetical protein
MMQPTDFIAIAGAVTASITPAVLAAKTFGPAWSSWLADFQVTLRRLSRRRRESGHQGISIYRLNVINERRPNDLDLIHDHACIDNRHRLCELPHSTNSATRLLKGHLRNELPR